MNDQGVGLYTGHIFCTPGLSDHELIRLKSDLSPLI